MGVKTVLSWQSDNNFIRYKTNTYGSVCQRGLKRVSPSVNLKLRCFLFCRLMKMTRNHHLTSALSIQGLWGKSAFTVTLLLPFFACVCLFVFVGWSCITRYRGQQPWVQLCPVALCCVSFPVTLPHFPVKFSAVPAVVKVQKATKILYVLYMYFLFISEKTAVQVNPVQQPRAKTRPSPESQKTFSPSKQNISTNTGPIVTYCWQIIKCNQ